MQNSCLLTVFKGIVKHREGSLTAVPRTDPGDVVARSGVNCLSLLMNDEDDAAPGPGTRRAEVEEGK